MFKEIIEKIKSYLFYKYKEKKNYLYEYYPSGYLPQSIVFDYNQFLLLPPSEKEKIFWDMYYTSLIISTAVEYIVNNITTFDFVFKSKIKGLTEILENLFQVINLENLIMNIARDIIIQGYSRVLIEWDKNNLIFTHLKYQDIDKVDKEFIFYNNKAYYIKDLIYIDLKHSKLFNLIPIYNIIRQTEDSLYLNLKKFGIPYIKFITKSKLSEEKQKEIKNKIKNFYKVETDIPIIFIEEDKVDIQFETPENLIKDYLEVIKLCEQLVYKALGILPTITTETGGSYAKAKTQAEIFYQVLQNLLVVILNELRIKLIPKLLVFYGYDDIVINNKITDLGYFELVKRGIEKDKLKEEDEG
ncbi:MAG: phage portal protein family protein [bacterium]